MKEILLAKFIEAESITCPNYLGCIEMAAHDFYCPPLHDQALGLGGYLVGVAASHSLTLYSLITWTYNFQLIGGQRNVFHAMALTSF